MKLINAQIYVFKTRLSKISNLIRVISYSQFQLLLQRYNFFNWNLPVVNHSSIVAMPMKGLRPACRQAGATMMMSELVLVS
jgi:hypothetical protein